MKFFLWVVFILIASGVQSQAVPDTLVEIQEEEIIEEDTTAYEEIEIALTDTIESPEVYADTVIQWMSFEEAEAAQESEPKKIFVDVYTSWCRWCRVSDSTVFRNPEIGHFINQNFYPVRFNGECKTPVVLKGKEYRFVKKNESACHELTELILKGNLSYPGYSCLDEKCEVVYSSNGYLSPAQVETVLHYLATGAYLEKGFTEFESTFEGKIPE